MDIIRTRQYYKDLNEEDLCSCSYCRNYYRQIKAAYPLLSDHLTGMGIDIKKPLEAIPMEPYEGMIEYMGAQYVVMGNPADFKESDIDGVSIRIAASHPMTEIQAEHFVIEIAPIRLKWVL